jgi:CHAT domain-containing protein/tetratricopeptide (TPR) repeat protein
MSAVRQFGKAGSGPPPSLGWLVPPLAVAPAGLAAVLVWRGSPVPALLLVLPALAVVANWFLTIAATRVLTPPQRHVTLSLEALGALFGISLAVALAAGVRRDGPVIGWLAGNAWWLAALVVLVPVVTIPMSMPRGLGWLPTIVRACADKGTVGFYAAALAGSPGLAELAAFLTGYTLLYELWSWDTEGNQVIRQLDARRFLEASPALRNAVTEAWLDQAVRWPAARGRPPRLDFVYTLCAQVAPSAGGHHDVELDAIQRTRRRPGAGAMVWVDHAEALVERAATQLPAPSAAQRRRLDLARARCQYARGDVYLVQALSDEAAAAHRKALATWRGYGLLDLSADIASTMALDVVQSPFSTGSATPEDWLPVLAELLGEPAVTPAMRRWLYLAAADCHAVRGEREVALEQRDRARHLAGAPLRRRRLNRDRRQAGMLVMSRATARWWDAVMELSWLFATGQVRLPGGAGNGTPAILTAGWHHDVAVALIKQSGRLWAAGQQKEATAVLERAAAALADDGMPGWAVQVLVQLGTALRDTDPGRAYQVLRRALELRESVRGSVLDDEARMRFGGGAEDLYTALVGLLAEAEFFPGPTWPDQPSRAAFELLEAARSRSMIELLGDRLPAPRGPAYTELVRAERTAARRLRELQPDGGPGLDVEALAEIRKERVELEGIWRRLAEAGPAGAEYAQLRQGRPLSFVELRELLADPVVAPEPAEGRPVPAGVVLAEYLVSEETTSLLVMRASEDEPVLETIPLGRKDLTATVRDHFGAGAGRSAEAFRTRDPAGWTEPLSMLIEPVVRHSAPGDQLWLVPHDVLHYVPLHALHTGQQPLIARNPVCYSPSASVMRYCRAKARAGRRRVVVYADSRADQPLAHARGQADALAALFPGEAVLRAGPYATIAALGRDLGRDGARIVHLACHGSFADRDPLRSGLLLAPSRDDTGMLTAERLMRMRLSADLVTLSACESGVNARHPGDELIGLTRSLIFAGAASVVVSLWAVDDLSTAILMRHFYTALAGGAGRAEALRAAQLALAATTLSEVVAHCETALAAAPDLSALGASGRGGSAPATLDALRFSLADARYAAGDFTAALAGYEQLAAGGEVGPRLLAALTRSRLAARHPDPGPPDYSHRPYTHPFYWAPFVLVGDWR